ncbi:hypothetical protein [Chryseobacterium sp. SNU WT5]|nr:hypothetical protein [Chryseobacterium sp. SNU WT5]
MEQKNIPLVKYGTIVQEIKGMYGSKLKTKEGTKSEVEVYHAEKW